MLESFRELSSFWDQPSISETPVQEIKHSLLVFRAEESQCIGCSEAVMLEAVMPEAWPVAAKS